MNANSKDRNCTTLLSQAHPVLDSRDETARRHAFKCAPLRIVADYYAWANLFCVAYERDTQNGKRTALSAPTSGPEGRIGCTGRADR